MSFATKYFPTFTPVFKAGAARLRSAHGTIKHGMSTAWKTTGDVLARDVTPDIIAASRGVASLVTETVTVAAKVGHKVAERAVQATKGAALAGIDVADVVAETANAGQKIVAQTGRAASKAGAVIGGTTAVAGGLMLLAAEKSAMIRRGRIGSRTNDKLIRGQASRVLRCIDYLKNRILYIIPNKSPTPQIDVIIGSVSGQNTATQRISSAGQLPQGSSKL